MNITRIFLIQPAVLKNTPQLNPSNSHMQKKINSQRDSIAGKDVAEIKTETRNKIRPWCVCGCVCGREGTSQVTLKDVFLSSNEAQEDRVNIHQPPSLSVHKMNPPAKNTSAL